MFVCFKLISFFKNFITIINDDADDRPKCYGEIGTCRSQLKVKTTQVLVIILIL